jgi:hypothetical protein
MVIHKYSFILKIIFLLFVVYIFSIYIIYPIYLTIINFNNNIEGFAWSKQTIHEFLKYQKTVNTNNHQYDMNVLQEQSSENEAKQLLSTGYWPWSDKTKYLYLDAVSKLPIINIDPSVSLDYAMKIYNEEAIKRLLQWNTKEGQFLIQGVILGNSENMPKEVQNTIKCTPSLNNDSQMEKIVYTGYNLRNGYKNSTTTLLRNEDLPKEIPGFSFVKKSCNPCLALNNPMDYSCPFTINIKGNNSISDIWKERWNL